MTRKTRPVFVPPLQRSAPSPGSQRKRSVGASSWSWRRWRPVWTSSRQATSCPASAPTSAYPNRCKWLPPSSQGRLWSWTWCPAGAPSQWLQQPSTWPPRPLLRRRPRKVSGSSAAPWTQLHFMWKAHKSAIFHRRSSFTGTCRVGIFKQSELLRWISFSVETRVIRVSTVHPDRPGVLDRFVSVDESVSRNGAVYKNWRNISVWTRP